MSVTCFRHWAPCVFTNSEGGAFKPRYHQLAELKSYTPICNFECTVFETEVDKMQSLTGELLYYHRVFEYLPPHQTKHA